MTERGCILVVDDEVGIRDLCRISLELAGHGVVEAANGSEALAVVAERPVDAIVLDVMMPGTDGWEVLQRMVDGGSHPPVLVLSASSGSGEAERAAALGARFMEKPFDPAQLCDEVGQMLADRERPVHET